MANRWILFVFLATAYACGPPPEQEWIYNRYPILNGEADTSQEHMAVVAVTDNYSMCTGTLIAPSVVLTAGHCISTRSMRVGFGNNVNWGMTWRTVTEKKVHPDYSGSSQSIVNDIAMVKFSGSAPAGVVPIAHLPHSLEITSADIGTQLVYVGYGQTAATNPNSAGVKMRMSNDLKWVCTNWWGCGYPAGYNTICQDQTPSGICSGDSGGPAFIFRSGREYVAGVASYTGQNCAQFGCSTKVDEYESFISDFIGGVPGAPCTSSADCLSGYYCVDEVCCTTLCNDVCMACNLTSDGTCRIVPNTTLCPDNNLCDGAETCQNGQCVEGAPLNCDNSNPCTTDRCDPAVGCIHDPVLDGTPCPDTNPCNGVETCLGGSCATGTPLDCDDHNLCTTDSCDPMSGCQHVDLLDGTGCGGGPCGSATCQGGECIYGDPTVCDDEDPCTEDWCDPDQGCLHERWPDGWECGDCRMCLGTECVQLENCESDGCGCGGISRPGGFLFEWLALFLVLGFLALGRKR